MGAFSRRCSNDGFQNRLLKILSDVGDTARCLTPGHLHHLTLAIEALKTALTKIHWHFDG